MRRKFSPSTEAVQSLRFPVITLDSPGTCRVLFAEGALHAALLDLDRALCGHGDIEFRVAKHVF